MGEDGEVVDVYLQAKVDGTAAKRFFKQLSRSLGSEPRKIVTDKLRSYGVEHRELIPETIHNKPDKISRCIFLAEQIKSADNRNFKARFPRVQKWLHKV